MAGAQIEIDTRQLRRAVKRLENLAGFNRSELLDAIGAEVESQTRRRIDEEKTAPDGTPWEEWSDAYAKTRHAGQSLLMGESDLLDSIQFFNRGDSVEVGTNLIYGAIHQFGGAEVGMNIPARPYLGLSSDNEADVLAVVEDFIEGALRA